MTRREIQIDGRAWRVRPLPALWLMTSQAAKAWALIDAVGMTLHGEDGNLRWNQPKGPADLAPMEIWRDELATQWPAGLVLRLGEAIIEHEGLSGNG